MRVETVVIECARELRLLGAVTPVNAREERERMLGAFARGSETTPRWLYTAHDVRTIRERLAMTRTRAPELVRQRIDELLLECAMVDAIGTPAFGDLAAKRFTCAREETDRLAKEWMRELRAARHASQPWRATPPTKVPFSPA